MPRRKQPRQAASAAAATSRRSTRASAQAEDKATFGQCPHLPATTIPPRVRNSLLNPLNWQCAICGTTESIWACLSCTHTGCGHDNGRHALQHFEQHQHPLVFEITKKYIHCYICNDYVLNDTVNGEFEQLRTELHDLETQQLHKSRTRSGLVIRNDVSGMDPNTSDAQAHKWKSADERDRVETALYHWRNNTLFRAFLAWKEFVEEAQLARSLQQTEGAASVQSPERETFVSVLDSPQATATASTARQAASRGASPLARIPARFRHKSVQPGLIGLRNLGQTCFMNAVVQMFGSIRLIRETLGEAVAWQDLDEAALASLGQRSKRARLQSMSNPRRQLQRQTTVEVHDKLERKVPELMFAKRRCTTIKAEELEAVVQGRTEDKVNLCAELEDVFRVMWSGKWSVLTPHSLLSTVWRIVPSFRGFQQQDAQELLLRLQDQLATEIQELIKRLEKYSLRPALLRLLAQSMDGRFRNEVICHHCGHESVSYEAFSSVSLGFPSQEEEMPTHLGVEDLLRMVLEPEELEEIYKCDGCSDETGSIEYRAAVKKTGFECLPRVLMLHLKRFRWSGIRREKIKVPVSFPETLDLRSLVPPETRVHEGLNTVPVAEASDLALQYRLVALVIHDGRGINSGHYHTFAFRGSWIHCNDARVAEVEYDEVSKMQAYILCYVQTGADIDLEDLADQDSLSHQCGPILFGAEPLSA
eukprot:m.170911 g.170911  ORF g.170911 m.170911 type:complete len:704 (-) comp10381_c0_seq2:42-2153(-)